MNNGRSGEMEEMRARLSDRASAAIPESSQVRNVNGVHPMSSKTNGNRRQSVNPAADPARLQAVAPCTTPARQGLGVVIIADEFYLKIPGQEALVGPIPKCELEDIMDARENANG